MSFSTSQLTLRLKEATDDLHGAAENLPAMRRLSSQDYQLTEYVALLEGLLDFHGELERRMISAVGKSHGLKLLRAPLLCADLESLGRPAIERGVYTLSPNLDLACPAVRAGMVYVIEGSALGGKVVASILQKRFGRRINRSTQYFRIYGRDVARVWRSVKSTLNELDIDHAQTVGAARACFEEFMRAVAMATEAGQSRPRNA